VSHLPYHDSAVYILSAERAGEALRVLPDAGCFHGLMRAVVAGTAHAGGGR